LIGAVRDTERRVGRRHAARRGRDLSHVGPRFGDPEVDDRLCAAKCARPTTGALAAAARGDAEPGSRRSRTRMMRRVCAAGEPPTHCCAVRNRAGRLLRYEHSRPRRTPRWWASARWSAVAVRYAATSVRRRGSRAAHARQIGLGQRAKASSAAFIQFSHARVYSAIPAR
jgi:hypothetical protein